MGHGGKREGAGRKHIGMPNPRTIKEFQDKIKTTWILKKLEEHIKCPEGTMVPSAVTAAVALLRKVLPDLASVEHSGEIATVSAEMMNDDELATVASRGSNHPAETAPDPSRLN
jgi:hypothetical protein